MFFSWLAWKTRKSLSSAYELGRLARLMSRLGLWDRLTLLKANDCSEYDVRMEVNIRNTNTWFSGILIRDDEHSVFPPEGIRLRNSYQINGETIGETPGVNKETKEISIPNHLIGVYFDYKVTKESRLRKNFQNRIKAFWQSTFVTVNE